MKSLYPERSGSTQIQMIQGHGIVGNSQGWMSTTVEMYSSTHFANSRVQCRWFITGTQPGARNLQCWRYYP